MNRLFLTIAVILAGVFVIRVQAGDWSVSGGYVTRLGMDIDIRGSSHVQAQGIHAATPDLRLPAKRQGGPPFRYDSGTPDLAGYADRAFDDGLVFVDPGTADPNLPGLTWYWGYDNASQYRPSANALDFHRSVSGTDEQTLTDVSFGEQVSRQTGRNDALALDDDVSGQGFGLTAGCGLYSKGMYDVEFCVGGGVLWGASSHTETSTYEERVRVDRIRVEDRFAYTDTHTYQDTYTYDTTGVVPPPAPYAGTYEGPGPLLPNLPSSSRRAVMDSQRQTQSTRLTSTEGSSTWTAANHVSFDVDSTACNLWLGPRLSINPCARLKVFATPSVSINCVNVDVDRLETFAANLADGRVRLLQTWTDSGNTWAWLFGAGLAVGADVPLMKGWFAGLQGGYDWVAGAAAVTVGPDRVSLDPSGYTLAGRLGVTF